jgi:hypothetical protein
MNKLHIFELFRVLSSAYLQFAKKEEIIQKKKKSFKKRENNILETIQLFVPLFDT